MNTSKTLLAILVEYLPKNGGWPDATTSIGQDWDRELMFYGRGCVRTGIILDDLAIDHRKRFENGVKITREQYESALNAHAEEKPEGKTLLQILTEELPKRGGWPEDAVNATQDEDGEVWFSEGATPVFGRAAWLDGDWCGNEFNTTTGSDYATAIITREQYEAAVLAATTQATITLPADDWIDWAGGECPLENGTIIDAKDRYGYIYFDEVIGDTNNVDDIFWQRGVCSDPKLEIIAYRLHQPQEAEQDKVDDEADLNECIGQDAAPVWNGCGVPPVGAEIEWREGRKWYPGTITAISEKMFVIKDQRGEEGSYYRDQLDIRAANFERDELAAIIEKSWNKNAGFVDAITLTAADLIDAGYRKQ